VAARGTSAENGTVASTSENTDVAAQVRTAPPPLPKIQETRAIRLLHGRVEERPKILLLDHPSGDRELEVLADLEMRMSR